MSRRPRRERGLSLSVEAALIVPGLALVIALLIGAGRIALSRQAVQQWADSAARTSTLARDAHTARARALEVVTQDASVSDVRCVGGWNVVLDTTAFALPVGQPGTVRVTIGCAVPLADLLLPGIPGSYTVEASASSTLDRHRGRP